MSAYSGCNSPKLPVKAKKKPHKARCPKSQEDFGDVHKLATSTFGMGTVICGRVLGPVLDVRTHEDRCLRRQCPSAFHFGIRCASASLGWILARPGQPPDAPGRRGKQRFRKRPVQQIAPKVHQKKASVLSLTEAQDQGPLFQHRTIAVVFPLRRQHVIASAQRQKVTMQSDRVAMPVLFFPIQPAAREGSRIVGCDQRRLHLRGGQRRELAQEVPPTLGNGLSQGFALSAK